MIMKRVWNTEILYDIIKTNNLLIIWKLKGLHKYFSKFKVWTKNIINGSHKFFSRAQKRKLFNLTALLQLGIPAAYNVCSNIWEGKTKHEWKLNKQYTQPIKDGWVKTFRN